MPQVGPLRHGAGVRAGVDRRVQVHGHDLRDPLQRVEVHGPVHDELREYERRQIADRDLVLVRELHDLAAQIRALDRPQVLLVRLFITRVLVEHVRGPGLHLGVEDGPPQLPRLDFPLELALGLVRFIQVVEGVAAVVREARALVGAHQSPVRVLLHAPHEQVRHPQPVEQISSAPFFLPVVLLQIEDIKNVRVPGLDVGREGARPLAAALVHVARRGVEDPQHRHQAVRLAARALDRTARRAHVGHAQSNTARRLGDARALTQ